MSEAVNSLHPKPTCKGIYILNGRKVVAVEYLLDWGRWMRDHQKEVVVATTHVGPVLIATKFIGICPPLRNNGRPEVFETLIYGECQFEKAECEGRCETWELAEIMHEAAVSKIRAST